MPSARMSVPHSLSRDEATRRIRNVIESLKEQYGNKISNARENWTEHRGDISFETMGFRVGATIQVETGSIQVNAQIPVAALPWKRKIESTIVDQLKALLS